jgi:hypothetical protein
MSATSRFYAPNYAEGEFSEVRTNGVLRSLGSATICAKCTGPGLWTPEPPAAGKHRPRARTAGPYSILSWFDLRFHRSLPLPAVHYYRVDERRQPDHDDEDVDDAG